MSQISRFDWWFNFAASPEGGAVKRLKATAAAFANGPGALFFINNRLDLDLPLSDAGRNIYRPVFTTSLQRLIMSAPYISEARRQFGAPEIYFSYGQPLLGPVGRLNWLHISNALTMTRRGISLAPSTRAKNAILGHQIIRSLRYADVCSAESEFCLDVTRRNMPSRKKQPKFVVLNNGQEDLSGIVANFATPERHAAITIGTYSYKRLDQTVALFDALKVIDPTLEELIIVGDQSLVPPAVVNHSNIRCVGNVPHAELIALLLQSRVYISSSQIENSSNAALEAIVSCRESYLSDIPSHRELLGSGPQATISLPSGQKYLKVERGKVPVQIVHPDWPEIIRSMLKTAEDCLREKAPS